MGIGYRMFVNSDESGGSIFSIKLDTQKPDDEVADLQGVKLFIDQKSAQRVSGYLLDYRKDKNESSFLLKKVPGIEVG